MRRRSIELQQADVELWNLKYPIGTRVLVHKDDGTRLMTETRSEAELLSGHTAVIWVNGISGCYALTHVEASV